MPQQLAVADLTPGSYDWQVSGTVASVTPTQFGRNSGCPYMSFVLEDARSQIRVVAFRNVTSDVEDLVSPGMPCVVTSHNGARVQRNYYRETLEIIVNDASALAVRSSTPDYSPPYSLTPASSRLHSSPESSPSNSPPPESSSPDPPQLNSSPAPAPLNSPPVSSLPDSPPRQSPPSDISLSDSPHDSPSASASTNPAATPTPLQRSGWTFTQESQDLAPRSSLHDPPFASLQDATSPTDEAPMSALPQTASPAHGQPAVSSLTLESAQAPSTVQPLFPTQPTAQTRLGRESPAPTSSPFVESQRLAHPSSVPQHTISPPLGSQLRSPVIEQSFSHSSTAPPPGSPPPASPPPGSQSSGSQEPSARTSSRPQQVSIAELTVGSSNWQVRGTVKSVVPTQLDRDSGCPFMSFLLEDDSALIRVVSFRDATTDVEDLVVPGEICVVTSCHGAQTQRDSHRESIEIVIDRVSAVAVEPLRTPPDTAPALPVTAPALPTTASSPLQSSPPARSPSPARSLLPARSPSPVPSSSLGSASSPALASSPTTTSSPAVLPSTGLASSPAMLQSIALDSSPVITASPAIASSSATASLLASTIMNASTSPPAQSTATSQSQNQGSQDLGSGSSSRGQSSITEITDAPLTRDDPAPVEGAPLAVLGTNGLRAIGAQTLEAAHSQPPVSGLFDNQRTPARASTIHGSPLRGSQVEPTASQLSLPQSASTRPAEPLPSSPEQTGSLVPVPGLPIPELSNLEPYVPLQPTAQASDRPAARLRPLSWLSRLIPRRNSRDSSRPMRSSNHVLGRFGIGRSG